MSTPVVQCVDLVQRFRRKVHGQWQTFEALSHVSLSLRPGEIVAVVGESGSGKSTLGKILVGLLAPTAGRVLYRGQDVRRLRGPQRHRYIRSLQIVQQDPFAAFNPVRRVGDALMDPLLRHRRAAHPREARALAGQLLAQVGLRPPEDFLAKYPHELSGGQLQRVAIARALTVDPELLVADEAVSMLDVSLGLGVVRLMRELSETRGLANLFITHDFGMAREFARGHKVVVMYAGRVVEQGIIEQVIRRPLHPYTRLLVEAVPLGDPEAERSRARLRPVDADADGILDTARACPFHPRCPFAAERCRNERPELTERAPGQEVACFFPLEAPLSAATPPTVPR